MVIEHEGVKLLTDPGMFTVEAQTHVTGLHGVLITHEHGDHLHIESLKKIIENNPTAVVIGNSAVAKAVGEAIADTAVVVVGDGQSTDINGIKVEGFGSKHAEIFESYGQVENTGYLLADKFYFPGDAFHNPGKKVDVLALPVAGPWMNIGMAIRFAQEMNAKTAFGVHDGMIVQSFKPFATKLFGMFVPETEYIFLGDGEGREF